MFHRANNYAIVSLTMAFLSSCSIFSNKEFKQLKLYSADINAFYKISPDTNTLKMSYKIKARVKNPDEFIKKLDNYIRSQKSLNYDSVKFIPSDIRMMYTTVKRDNSEKIILQVCRGPIILYNNKYYAPTMEIRELLLSPIPEQERKEIWKAKRAWR